MGAEARKEGRYANKLEPQHLRNTSEKRLSLLVEKYGVHRKVD